MSVAEAVRDLALDRPLVEALIGRPLRLAEQAIDVVRLDQALEHAKDQLEQAIRDEMERATAAWASGATVRPILELTGPMLEPLLTLRGIGEEEALNELARLGYVGLRSGRAYVANPAPHRRDWITYVLSELAGITVRIERDLVQADLAGAASAAVAHALLPIPGARDVASRVVSTALIDGMAQTWERNQDLVGGWEYTAILDSGTCDECAPLDGTQYATVEELFVVLPDFGPNPACLGGGRCRCRAVPLPV